MKRRPRPLSKKRTPNPRKLLGTHAEIAAAKAELRAIVRPAPAEADTMEATLRAQLAELRKDTKLPPFRRFAAIRATAEALARVTGETTSMPESKLVRTPAFRRLLEVMVEASRPWPDCQRAIGEALTEAAKS